jgi:protein-S-isoprenylcysteine O-methyltransferase Ste14
MTDEFIFRLILAAIIIGVFAIRIYYRRLATRTGGPVTEKEDRRNLLFRGLIAITGILTLLAYLLYPESMAWARLDLPDWARWLGAGLGVAAVALLLWVHTALRENFSGTLHIRAEHTLVTNGPYQWVRHPMYTSFYLLAGAFFLLSANWFIGLAWFAGLTLVMVTRVAHEETVMREKFGAAYAAYMRRTGRFLPLLLGR